MKHKHYDINMEVHLRYVQTQKHTRGDVERAKKALNPPRKGRIVGECRASSDIKPKEKTLTTGNTAFVSIKGRVLRLSPSRCRVMNRGRK